MAIASPLLLQLGLSFIIATLRLTVDPLAESKSGDLFVLISPNRNITFKLVDGSFVYADSLQINRRAPDLSNNETGEGLRVSIRCLNDFALKLEVNDEAKVIPSPSLCKRDSKNELLIGPDDSATFHGCVKNVTLGSRFLLSSWCRAKNDSAAALTSSETTMEDTLFSDSALQTSHSPLQAVYVGEPVHVVENQSVALLWKNFYLFPEHRRFRISNNDVIFEVIDPPEHGYLRFDGVSGKVVRTFNYDDLLGKRVFYVHNGDEHGTDDFDLQVDIRNSKLDFGDARKRTCTIRVKIEQKNDPPQIVPGFKGALVLTAPGVKALLTEEHVKIWDSDSPTNQVFVRVKNSVGGARFTTKNADNALSKFSLTDFINKKIFISIDSAVQRTSGSIEVDAVDSSGSTSVNTVVVRVTSNPVDIRMMQNTGLRLSHKASQTISAQNMSFSTASGGGFAVPLTYVIVDQPEFGIVECASPVSVDGYQLCSTFKQTDLESGKVRYKHTSENRPKSDVFTFKVIAGDSETSPHDFRIEFIPISVRVLIQESLLLNNTEKATIFRRNLLATTFPSNFPRDELVYHIVEPPKFGMLYRKIDSSKNRRIGVSSNFTQAHVDTESVYYKLNFVHYSIVNDFFTFRLVTPAVTSELLRFEVVYIPNGNSIQLLNRTLIVPEGSSQAVTNNTLWLETADDTTFDFTIAVAPFSGSFVLSNKDGAKFILGAGDRFDSFDIAEKRLFYEHSGDESRSDRAYLIAESRYRPNTKIPLWFTVSVINEDDHLPLLEASGTAPSEHTIYVVEKAERTLTRSLFPWTDRDSKDTLLKFAFSESSFKDFVFFSKDNSQLPVRSFTTKDLDANKLVVRHQSLKKSAQMRYTVSDGKHTSSAVLHLVAQQPFVKLEKGQIDYLDEHFGGLVPVMRANLSCQTNLDHDLGDVKYSIRLHNSSFRMLQGGLLNPVDEFSQKDIDNNRIFYDVSTFTGTATAVPVVLRIGHLETTADIRIQKAPESFQFKIQNEVFIGQTEIVTIDEAVLDVRGESGSNLKFLVVQQPQTGSLSLDTVTGKLQSSNLPSNAFVYGFRLEDLQHGRLQYIPQRHFGRAAEDDSFSVRIQTNRHSFGPFNVYFKKESASGPKIVAGAPIHVQMRSNVTLDPRDVKILNVFGYEGRVDVRITKQPAHGRIALRHDPRSPVDGFSLEQLNNGLVTYVSTARAEADSFQLSVCVAAGACSTPTTVQVVVEKDNLLPPEIVKNEPLNLVNSNTGKIGVNHLNVNDPDSSPEMLKFLVWQPVGGFVAYYKDQKTTLNSFSFADLQTEKIVFVSTSNSSGGFSFLVTDGLFQTRPEYFSIEKTKKLSITLEANSRLLAAPLQHAIIGTDLLRAKIPDVAPSDIVYTVSRAPGHGKIMLNQVKIVQKFTQQDLDSRRISYFSDQKDLGAWSQKDYFNFVVSVNQLQKVKEEFRFKVSLTFGALNQNTLNSFVDLRSPLKLVAGSSLALNSSILDLSRLVQASGRDQLIVEVYRRPRNAELVVVEDRSEQATNSREDTGASQLTSGQVSSGRHLLLKGAHPGDDEVVFHVYSASDKERKKSNRLRISLLLEIKPREPDSFRVKQFREELDIVSGGSAKLEPSDFQVEADSTLPNEITYRLLQRGSNGVRVVVLDSPPKTTATTDEIVFTQAQVNKGQVRLEHTPLSTDDRFDVLVFGVGGLTKAVVVRVEPLALNLFNHSVVSIEQGKTYVVLTRAHLGADSNGDRAKIVYNVTKAPENGTFYWVNGETQAEWFTQKNVDDGDVLYAQLNMDAYQDAFEFTLGNEEMEMLQKASKIVVLPKIEVQDLITDAKQFTQINVGFLNASALEGSTPRYLVISPPNFGRLFLHPFPNESVVFFTQTEVGDGKLFFHAFDVDERIDDEVEFELRGDGIQPARFKWRVDIRPMDKRLGVVEPGSRQPTNEVEDLDKATPNIAPELNQHFPVIVLVGIIIATVIILCCRHNSSKRRNKKKNKGVATRDEQGLHLNLGSERELPSVPETRGAELLDSTVYASVGKQRRLSALKDIEEEPESSTLKRPSYKHLESFEQPPGPPHVKVTPLRHPFGSAGSAFKPTPLAALSKTSRSGPITGLPSVVPALKQPRGSLDAQAKTTKLKQNQYWV